MGAGSYRGYRGGRNSVLGMHPAIWLAGMAALAGVGFLMSAVGIAQPFQSAAQRIGAPVTAALHGATAPMVDFVANVGSYGRLRTENRELRSENERLQVELAQMREDDHRAAQVADLLKIGQRAAGERLTYASLVSRDPSPRRDAVAINRGARDGLASGMPVLGKGGALVGTVERVGDTVSWVRLITDPRSAVNARIQESRALALAAGDDGRTVQLEFLAQDVVVKPGDQVLTSGLGGQFPEGLLIGRVEKVEGGPPDVFKRVQVEPAVQLSSLESVAVLTSFRPAPIEGLTR